MNFVALIGIVKSIEKNEQTTAVELECEAFKDNPEENTVSLVPVVVNNKVFESELKVLKVGDIIGVKGTCFFNKKELSVEKAQVQDLTKTIEQEKQNEKELGILAERVQIFN
ncbi:MAG: hypothetical protein LBC44_03380 [Mycoplasmataceae bacterium]|nr:hypothetical protein [Mycoplasmataceae bacterium]